MSTIEKALKNFKAKQELESKETGSLVQDVVESNVQNKSVLYIDDQYLFAKGMISKHNQSRKIRDEYRSIKLKLLNNAAAGALEPDSRSNLIMVTSTNPSEGKTFTAINLALSIALEQDKTVLLVDTDVLKPSICQELQLKPEAGLLEYLSEQVEQISDVIYHTNISNLKIIPAGSPHVLSNELLASSKMQSLVQEFSQRYKDRVVIFDCPPLLGINETKVLASLVGQVVMVVNQDKTKLEEINEAVQTLSSDLAVGFVMNKVVRGAFSQYGYGYGGNTTYGEVNAK